MDPTRLKTAICCWLAACSLVGCSAIRGTSQASLPETEVRKPPVSLSQQNAVGSQLSAEVPVSEPVDERGEYPGGEPPPGDALMPEPVAVPESEVSIAPPPASAPQTSQPTNAPSPAERLPPGQADAGDWSFPRPAPFALPVDSALSVPSALPPSPLFSAPSEGGVYSSADFSTPPAQEQESQFYGEPDHRMRYSEFDEPSTAAGDTGPPTLMGVVSDQWEHICTDHLEFYSPENCTWLAAGLVAGGLMANTGFDQNVVRDGYFENVVLPHTDGLYETLHDPKFLGNGWNTIPVFMLAAFSEPLLGELPLGRPVAEWGQRSLRTVLVGAPPMLALQVLTGGSRPGETRFGSRWKPFQDNNGVSGHSFMGAIPFLCAAKMTENVWLKAGLYGMSTLPGLSRINDDRHYFSQVFLGWWLAYAAASAVDRSQNPDDRFHFLVVPQLNGIGAVVDYQR